MYYVWYDWWSDDYLVLHSWDDYFKVYGRFYYFDDACDYAYDLNYY